MSGPAPPFPSDRYPSVKDLCLAVIGKFRSSALKSEDRGLGPGAQPRPVEAQYQDEFYRACYALLGNIYLSSEWSGKGKNGSVDFLVKSLGWAIECVRDGDRLEEHISRFQVGGRYHRWICSGDIKEYILLDFRISQPQKRRGMAQSNLSSWVWMLTRQMACPRFILSCSLTTFKPMKCTMQNSSQ